MIVRRSQCGFTLIEMIMVIVITGIIGSMVAVFLRAPINQYVDIARRAEMTDIADTALRRISRDLRLALPNSVRVSGACNGAGTCFMEFLPTIGGGRYRAEAGAGVLCAAVAGNAEGDALSFDASDTCFEVLGAMPPVAAGNQIVVLNYGNPDTDAYAGNTLVTHNRRAVSAAGVSTISIISPSALSPILSAGAHRFQVVATPVTYACAPAPGGVGGTLTRWQGYAIQAAQPIALPAGGTASVLANNVSNCIFVYDSNVVTASNGLVSMNLGITINNDTVRLYGATHVSNAP